MDRRRTRAFLNPSGDGSWEERRTQRLGRVRLLDRSRMELGTSLRLGVASIRNGEKNPFLVAPGAFVAYRLTDTRTRRGPRVHFGYAYGTVDNVGGKWETTHRGTAGLTWIF